MSGLTLIPSTDAHFAWMLGEAPAPDGLTLPPGGVDAPWVLKWLRRTLPQLGGYGGWLMTANGEVVGLASYKSAPDAMGGVEIGYAVAPERRRRGHATRAVALLIEAARLDTRVDAIVAETALANLPSQRVLEATGFRQTGRGHDDDEGEMILWRLDLAQTVARELLAARFNALYVTEAGRLVCTNEWDARPAPRFHLMRTAFGADIRCRRDVPDDLARQFEGLARSEAWDPTPVGEAATYARYVDLLAGHAPVERLWSGPAFACLRRPRGDTPTISVDPENAGLLRGRFDDWVTDVPHRRPFVAVVEDGKAVSICASVRMTAKVHCAGVETHLDHRRRGHAVTAVTGWARAVRALGATPFYSTSWDNEPSRHVAQRLGFQLVATDFHMT